MKKVYFEPNAEITVFGEKSDAVLGSLPQFDDKYVNQPPEWNVWLPSGGDRV